MIKIFRKIRQQLLQENRFSRYTLYATGEILLVVIGILIALQINNWNENRKQNNRESLYLNRLLIENKQDISTFTQSIADLENGNQTIVNLSKLIKDINSNDSILIDSAKEYLISGCHYPFFNPSTSTFDDLSSTGNLDVITDTGLRDQIVNHYANYKSVESNFLVNTNWALPIDAPFYIDNDILIFEPTTAFLFPEKSTTLMAMDLRKDSDKFIRNAAVHYWINKDCIALLKDIKNETSELIVRLENEVK